MVFRTVGTLCDAARRRLSDRRGRDAMMDGDRYLLVRAAALYITVVLTVGVWAWRRPDARAVRGAVLACLWNLPAVLLLHVVATRAGWWRFEASGGLLLGMPVDFYLEWVWLWGGLALLAFPSQSLSVLVLVLFAIDAVLMRSGEPVI